MGTSRTGYIVAGGNIGRVNRVNERRRVSRYTGGRIHRLDGYEGGQVHVAGGYLGT